MGKIINCEIFNHFLSSELLQGKKILVNFDKSPKSKIVLEVGYSTSTMQIKAIRVFFLHHMCDQLNKLNRSQFRFELEFCFCMIIF